MKKIYVGVLMFLLCFTALNFLAVERAQADGVDAIYIDDNTDFATYASSGNGTIGNPYIIQNRVISSFGGDGIHVEGTDAYCIFNNIDIVGDSPQRGIYLLGASNINVTAVTIDGQRTGILIKNCSTIGVLNVNVTYYDDFNTKGIWIDQSDNVLVEDCYLEGMDAGVLIWSSHRVAIRDNVFIGNGILLFETKFMDDAFAVTGNTVNGLPIGFLKGARNLVIDVSGYGQVILLNCVNVTVYGADISNVNTGIQLFFCLNVVVNVSEIVNTHYGILVYESAYCQLSNNDIHDNYVGVFGWYAVGTIIRYNNFTSNEYGLWNYRGCRSSNIYENNFIDNIQNARDDGARDDSNLNWVAGKFMNSVSNWPLNNVSVTIQRAGRTYVGYTNNDGFLRVPVPLLGTYSVTIEKLRYQTISTDITVSTDGIHLYNVQMNKTDLGPGTGYVRARILNGDFPVEGATVTVYSYADGAYYYHDTFTSVTGGEFAGWVNITGLYYDKYVFEIYHPQYFNKTMTQVIISDGLAGTYNNIQMDQRPFDAFITGHIYDFTNDLPLEGVNITLTNQYASEIWFTDSNGFYNITNLPFSSYSAEVSLDGYDTEYRNFDITVPGSFHLNPVDIYMIPSDYVPEALGDSVVDNWDNQVNGNYWDDLGGEVVLAADGPYYIPGDAEGDPMDEYPLDAPFVHESYEEPTTTPTFSTTTPTTPIDIPEMDWTVALIVCVGGIGVIALIVVLKKRI